MFYLRYRRNHIISYFYFKLSVFVINKGNKISLNLYLFIYLFIKIMIFTKNIKKFVDLLKFSISFRPDDLLGNLRFSV